MNRCFFPMSRTLAVALLTASWTTVSLAQGGPPAGPPGGLGVNVVNTPLPVQGTVNVGNFPTSNTVTGSVSITGTPNVNVVNTPSVHNADNPAFQPVFSSFSAPGGGSVAPGPAYQVNAANSYQVPVGKRLVIEYVSAELTITPFTNTGSVILQLTVADATFTKFAIYDIGATAQTFSCAVAQELCFVITKSLRLYANPGDHINVRATVAINQTSQGLPMSGSISGYLVDLQ